jgi:trehalose 2-sulfotransferase
MRAPLVRLATHVSSLRKRLEEAGVERTFFVCSTPRTGSTMLGNLLAETGLVGRAGEYFGDGFRRDVVPGLTRRGFDDYLVDCVRHARGTGVLGIKLHWDQVADLLHLLRLRRGHRGASDGDVLASVFPAPHHVWLTREDTIAQAVSWWRAMTSGKWTDGRPVTGEPRFDADGIAGRLDRVEEHNAAWRGWFTANGIEPLPLTYEELTAEPAGAVRRTLAFLGVPLPDGLTVEHVTEKQGDELNEDWIRRYRTLKDSGSGSQAASTT